MDTKRVQRDLKAMGVYDGRIDGAWGPKTEVAYTRAVSVAGSVLRKETPARPIGPDAMAWGKKVSAAFKTRVRAICQDLGVRDPDWLMACMAFETGERFSPDVRNGAGSGATGLIQFMPSTARGLGTSTDALAQLSAEDQLDYVHRYFRPYKGRLKNLGDLYMAILWPAGIGKADDWELWARDTRETTYMQNRGLDLNKDGVITRGEAVAKVDAKLRRGRQFYYG